jgi:hypothetical protein
MWDTVLLEDKDTPREGLNVDIGCAWVGRLVPLP